MCFSLANAIIMDFFSSEDEVYSNDDTSNDAYDIVNDSSVLDSSDIPILPKISPLLINSPEPLAKKHWDESDTKFKVRSNTYMRNNKKVLSGKSFFRLIAVDLIRVEIPLKNGICNHPKERVQQWLRNREAVESSIKEKKNQQGAPNDINTPENDWEKDQKLALMPPFIFCVNIIVPPSHHLVFFYAVDDLSLIQDNNTDHDGSTTDHAQFTKLASKFFFGSSDSFRDNTFKLVPRIVKGNCLVKKAVGTKPTIIGRKLKQLYIMNERFFEIIIDVGSDSIAKKIVGLASGRVRFIKILVLE